MAKPMNYSWAGRDEVRVGDLVRAVGGKHAGQRGPVSKVGLRGNVYVRFGGGDPVNVSDPVTELRLVARPPAVAS